MRIKSLLIIFLSVIVLAIIGISLFQPFSGHKVVDLEVTFSQGDQEIYVTTPLDELKSMIQVVEVKKDKTTNQVDDYTLIGNLTEGTCEIIVKYQDYEKPIKVMVISKDFTYELKNDNTYAITGIGTYDQKELVIPNTYKNIDITSINEEAFLRNNQITKVVFLEDSKVDRIGTSAFQECRQLTSIILPKNLITIENSVFENCVNLLEIFIPRYVTSIKNNAFTGCINLAKISVDNDNGVYDSRENCNAIIETSTDKLISGCKNTKISADVEIIGEYAFAGSMALTEIVIPSSVTTILEGAFRECTIVRKIVIPASVVTMENYVFNNCTNLTIYCRASSQPETWKSEWNSYGYTVVWDYIGE